MKKFNITILLIASTIIVCLVSIFVINYIDQGTTSKKQVYLVIKTVSENTDFWLNVTKGASVAATELGVEVIVKGPIQEINIQDQIDIMYDIIKKKPEAIAIAASDYYLLADACNEAINNGITLVSFDSDVKIDYGHSFIATNNLTASQRLAHELGTLIDHKGSVAIVGHVEGSFTAIERVEGFKKGLKPFENIHVLENEIYADNNREIAYEKTLQLIKDYPDLVAIYATNEVTLLGCGEAIGDSGLKDKIKVVGFDMSNEIALMIERGIIQATMVQKPFNMGYISIKEALEVMNGKDTETIDTGAVLINKENMFLPENQKLIVPNVK